MPDWSYQPIFRPLARLLGPKVGRRLLLGGLGTVARLPGGRWLIELLGHARPSREMAFRKAGLAFPCRAGIACLVDGQLQCPAGLVRLGIGALEVGPLLLDPPTAPEQLFCDWRAESVVVLNAGVRRPVSKIVKILKPAAASGVPLLLRLQSPRDLSRLIADADGIELAKHVAGFVISTDVRNPDVAALESVVHAVCDVIDRPIILLAIPFDASPHIVGETAGRLARNGQIAGLLLEPPAGASCLTSRKADLPPLLAALPVWRSTCGDEALLIARGGINEPGDALRAVHAGADLILLDSGLVHAGPGLPKRINAAISTDEHGCASSSGNDAAAQGASPVPARPTAQSWFWLMLLGVGLFMGGLMTLAVAITRVVLPYDEALTGLSRLQIMAINPRLLDFMRHDRITLSGTMLAVGILYLALTIHGVRRGMHWAWLTVVTSAAAGYFSFFLFLGFGYFDPFHAFVTAISFPLLLLGIYAPLAGRDVPAVPDLTNDWRWRLGLWGQVLFIMHGVLIIAAGLTISCVGATTVFVPQDMEFLCTADGLLQAAHPQLVPLVAHDRASFGGMLVTCGVATLLPALWGLRRGEAWLWRAIVSAGTVAYLITLAVHLAVGYTSAVHLLPVYGGLAGLWLAAALSAPFLCDRRPAVFD